MFRKCVSLPTTTLAAIAMKNANSDPEYNKQDSVNDLRHYQCKATELPLYAPLHSYDKQEICDKRENLPIHAAIKCGVRVVRIEIQNAFRLVNNKTDIVLGYFYHAKDKTHSVIEYLNEPQNMLPRTGAIAIGGLSGFIFAARGGFIKKVFYTSIGAGAVASLCYPNEAQEFAKEALFEARKGYAIAYNFIKGVKPGDQDSIRSYPEFPSSLAEIKYMVSDLCDEAKNAIFADKK